MKDKTIIPLRQLSNTYSALWSEADAVFKKHNPCQHRWDEVLKKVQCRAGEPCCGGCQHLSGKGCTVKALSCKVWTCHVLQMLQFGELKEFFADLLVVTEKLQTFPVYLGLRASKQTVMGWYIARRKEWART